MHKARLDRSHVRSSKWRQPCGSSSARVAVTILALLGSPAVWAEAPAADASPPAADPSPPAADSSPPVAEPAPPAVAPAPPRDLLQEPQAPRAVRAAEPGFDPLPSLSDEEIAQREAFLDRALRINGRLVLAWHITFTTIYGAGMVVQTGRAVIAPTTAEQADELASAVKALIGTVSRLIVAPRAVLGARPVLDLPNASRRDRANRLFAAEALLRRDAIDSDLRYHWLGHTLNVALNLASGLIVWLGYHDLTRAAESTALGLGVGEAQIWLRPWYGKRAWADYRRRYGATAKDLYRGDARSAAPLRLAPHVSATSFGLSF